jgi:hypothetical protein
MFRLSTSTLRKFILSGLFAFLFLGSLLASHEAGGEITYTCIGPNQYAITLTLYRDCSGISAATTYPLNYRSNACGVNANVTLNWQSTTDITPLCPSANSACNGGGGSIGFERLIYTGILTLPSGCNDWILSTSSCCRNGAVTNLNSPDSQDIYIQTTLNNTVNPCNSSPTFSNNPQLFACVGQQVNYQQLATDPDGDVLVYSLVNAMNAPGTSVTYAGGFSGTNPFTVPVTVDPQTGEISFTPNVTQVAVVAVLVQEYRNGVLIGSVMRDIQFNIINCTNTIPSISGINNVPGDYTISTCVGANLCFDILASDIDAGQTVTMTTGNSIPGSQLTQSGSGSSVTGTFCWTPTSSDIGTHYISVYAQDNACPLIGQNSQIYEITVIANPNPPVNAGADVSICEGQSTTLTATTGAAPGIISSFTWTPSNGLSSPNTASTSASPSATTNYTVTLNYTDGCFSTDQVTVAINTAPVAIIFPETANVCSGASFMLSGSTDVAGMNFQWFNPSMVSLGSGTVSGTGSTLSVTVPSAAGSYVYTLVVTNPITGCTATDVTTLIVGSPPALPSCVNIYATPTGNAASQGTQADPTTLANALTIAQCNNAVIKLAIGTYNIANPLTLSSFVTIEGGFNPATWEKSSLAGATTINRTNASPEGPANGQRLVAFYGNSLTGFRLQDLTITTAAGTAGTGMSTYGLHLTNCSNYNIVRTQILPGAAGSGAGDDNIATYNAIWDGANGANGANGITGGGPQCTCNIGTDNGGTGGNGGGAGAGGANATTIGGSAGAGAAGGRGGDGRPDNTSANGFNGIAGTGAGGGGAGGTAGTGGSQDGNGNSTSNVGNGGAGGAGTNGINGVTIPGSFAVGFWIPGSATNGTSATGGGGGGGGGGAARDTDNCDAAGGGGSGGGGGGGGGGAGRGAFGGGSSFGIYLYNNGAGGNLIQDRIIAGTAGAGGIGGRGGNGGTNGTSVIGNGCTNGDSDGNRGGAGGSGGTGGTGGNGGNGPSGFSINIHLDGGSALALDENNFNLAAQPTITASNVNCTNTNVTYTSTAPAAWDFDLVTNNAVPATAGAVTPTITQYTAIGRYTIGMGANTYSGFHNIAFSGSIEPNIITNAPQIGVDTFQLCVGDFASFQSDTYGTSYIWNFNGAIANPGSVQTLNAQFNTPGFYPITLNVITDCCGNSPTATVYLYVLPNPAVTGSGNIALCEGQSGVLTVNGMTASNSVVWSPTDGIISSTANSITVSPVSTTNYIATVSSFMTFPANVSGCPVNLNYTVTVNEVPELVMSSTPIICSNDGTATANVVGGGSYNFAWSNGANNNGVPSSTITGLTSGSYSVTVTNPVTTCSNNATIFVYPGAANVQPIVVSNTPTCVGYSTGEVTVNTIGGTAPYTYLWNGVTSSSANPLVMTGLPAGNYPVLVTDNIGCQATIIVDIPELPLPEYEVHINGPICEGGDAVFELHGTDGAVLTYNIGAGDVSVVLSHDPQFVTITGATADVTMTLVSIFDDCTVPLIDSYTVTVNPVHNITQNIVICYNSDYTYPDGTTHTSIIAAESYTSNITSTLGCDSTIVTNLTLQALPNAGTDGTLTICEGTIVTEAQLFAALNGTPDAIGTWSPALAGAGPYTYTVAATAPCTTDATAVIVATEQAATGCRNRRNINDL